MDVLLAFTQTADVIVPTATVGAASLKIWAYAAFIGLIFLFLALDLGVFHREAHEVSMKEAAIWSVIWLSCGVLFSGVVYFGYENKWLGLGDATTPIYNTPEAVEAGEALIIQSAVSGRDALEQYLVGYVVEKSLAMDNIFVIALIFSYFAIPGKYQHRVLFWGIIGALIMRGGMIFIGAGVILKYQWILILFGGFLILTALKMAIIKGNDDPSQNMVVKLLKRFFPITNFFDGQRFFTHRTLAPTYSTDPATGKQVQDPAPEGTLSKKMSLTPLFVALVLVEVTDLVFAVDSIPAIFAITPDPFIVFTSNILAILGLRSLYFCLAAMITKFRYLKPALILILAFVGVKLLLLSLPPYLDNIAGAVGLTINEGQPIKIDTTLSLVIVLGTLILAVVASILRPSSGSTHVPPPPSTPLPTQPPV
jgi:tellurite resistance protein TerC